MNLELKFKKLLNRLSFDTRDYWELRYKDGGNSGVGSYGAYCDAKAECLNTIISKYQIEQVTELGCGDGNQLQYYNFPKYLGLDISQTAIEKCQIDGLTNIDQRHVFAKQGSPWPCVTLSWLSFLFLLLLL